MIAFPPLPLMAEPCCSHSKCGHQIPHLPLEGGQVPQPCPLDSLNLEARTGTQELIHPSRVPAHPLILGVSSREIHSSCRLAMDGFCCLQPKHPKCQTRGKNMWQNRAGDVQVLSQEGHSEFPQMKMSPGTSRLFGNVDNSTRCQPVRRLGKI